MFPLFSFPFLAFSPEVTQGSTSDEDFLLVAFPFPGNLRVFFRSQGGCFFPEEMAVDH